MDDYDLDFCLHHVLGLYKVCTKYSANPDWWCAKNNANFYQRFNPLMLSCELTDGAFNVGQICC